MASRRIRPGIGEPGRTRIREELAEFKVAPVEEDLYEEFEPPSEPPEDGVIDRGPKLPPPEYISNILQATWPAGTSAEESRFQVLRPDNDSRFYEQGSARSTRVYAIQWIPTNIDEYGRVTGDIFVAFARPSKSVGSSLFMYPSKDFEAWETFKSSNSLGRGVKLLGTAISQKEIDEETIESYKSIHPMYSSWIFDPAEMVKWATIRPNNSIEGDRRPRKPRGRARYRELGEVILKETGKSVRDFRSKTSDDDYY